MAFLLVHFAPFGCQVFVYVQCAETAAYAMRIPKACLDTACSTKGFHACAAVTQSVASSVASSGGEE